MKEWINVTKNHILRNDYWNVSCRSLTNGAAELEENQTPAESSGYLRMHKLIEILLVSTNIYD